MIAVWEYLSRNHNVTPQVSKDTLRLAWHDTELLVIKQASSETSEDNIHLIECYSDGSVVEFANFYRQLVAKCLVNYQNTVLK